MNARQFAGPDRTCDLCTRTKTHARWWTLLDGDLTFACDHHAHALATGEWTGEDHRVERLPLPTGAYEEPEESRPRTLPPEDRFGESFGRFGGRWLGQRCPDCDAPSLDLWLREGATAGVGVCPDCGAQHDSTTLGGDGEGTEGSA